MNLPNLKDIDVAGKRVIEAEIMLGFPGGKFEYIYFIDEPRLSIVISFGKNSVVDKILSTFKFIEAASASSSVIEKICAQEKQAVKVSQCGEYYTVYPVISGGIVVDAATKVYDSSGVHLNVYCGGYQGYASEADRRAQEEQCASYLKDCTEVKSSC